MYDEFLVPALAVEISASISRVNLISGAFFKAVTFYFNLIWLWLQHIVNGIVGSSIYVHEVTCFVLLLFTDFIIPE